MEAMIHVCMARLFFQTEVPPSAVESPRSDVGVFRRL